MANESPKETRIDLQTTGTYRTHDAAGRLVEERPAVFIQKISLMQTMDRELVTFISPSACALALRAAIDAAEHANNLLKELEWGKVPTPFGEANDIHSPGQTALFDCLEKSMIAVTFSYLALENYSNETISITPNQLVQTEVRGRDRKTKVMKPAKHFKERGSTDEKLASVLPQLMAIPTPKGSKTWEPYRHLQRTRNDIIHLKSRSSDPRTRKRSDIPKETVFYRFLTQDATQYPTAAVNMILYFAVHRYIPDWLLEPMSRMGMKTPLDSSPTPDQVPSP